MAEKAAILEYPPALLRPQTVAGIYFITETDILATATVAQRAKPWASLQKGLYKRPAQDSENQDLGMKQEALAISRERWSMKKS